MDREKAFGLLSHQLLHARASRNSAAKLQGLPDWQCESVHVFEFITIFASTIAFPVVHLLNGWLFSFAEITPNIGLIYLPAFIRLFNVLVLGPIKGTFATYAGGLLLMFTQENPGDAVDLLSIACSAGGPLVAVFVFQFVRGRSAQLSALGDVAAVALIYCVANAVLHHLMWSFFDPTQLAGSDSLFWMALGDFNGALLGAYGLKWVAHRLKIGQPL